MKQKITKKRIRKFLSYYRPWRRIFIMDMCFAGLSAAAVLLFPLLSGYITGEVLSSWDADTQRNLLLAAVGMAVLAAAEIGSNITYAYFGHAMGARMEGAMREELFAHYERLSFRFHGKNSVGKLMTVASNDLNGMTELFHHGPEDILKTLIKFVGAFVILIQIHVPLTLILFSVLPVLGYAAYRADRIMEAQLLRSREDLAQMNEKLEDTLAGVRTVKAFGQEREEAAEFAQKNRKYTDSQCLFYKVEAEFYESMRGYPRLLTMLAVVFGALFIGRGTLDVPVLVTFLLYVGTLAEPVNTVMNFMRLYEEGKAGFIRFMDMLETEPEIEEAEHPVRLADPKGEIVFEHVDFRYEKTGPDVLKDVSFRIESGQSVAFAGVSGIGKTTISLLLARFYDVTGGRICIDGTDIRQLSLDSLRGAIGLVQQEVYIFNGTIRDNIRYGKWDASQEEIEDAARKADIHDFIMSLEKGYDTEVGTRGIRLSGGQRQRVSIARLFLKDPKILILDEATSALDYESERAVQESLERLMQGRTSIVIAHRLSTIRGADQIYVIGKQNIVEQGTHEELLARGGEYARLCRLGLSGPQ